MRIDMRMELQHPPRGSESEHHEQYIRCYVVPEDPPTQRRPQRQPRQRNQRHRRPHATTLSEEGQAIKALGAPYEGWCFAFDTETTTDTAQALRYGFYLVAGIPSDERMRLLREVQEGRLTADQFREALDTVHEEGCFYNPATMTAEEIALLRDFADEQGIRCMDRDTFIRDVFYRWVYRYQALCIGHNLPFDLGALAIQWGEAAVDYRGGFTLQLCSCEHMPCALHPPVRVKSQGRYKARIGFQRARGPVLANGRRMQAPQGRGGHTGQGRGKFLDTATLGRALLGPGDVSLKGLGERFNVAADKRKLEMPDFDGPLTREQLEYASRDVLATFALYQQERALYRQHAVSKPMWHIYSEASLGKAYYAELGVPKFLEQHPDFPPEVTGYGMVAYYGGRSEVHIRLQPVEVIYTDFKSQYPTVNALMGLQELLLAKHISVEDATQQVRDLLSHLPLADLQDPAFWRRLRCLVKIRPDHDVLPVRTQFGPEGLNIALAEVTGPLVWYTLADAIASTLRTDKAPEVLQAVTFVPSAERVETRPFRLFGDEHYTIDLSRHDFFTEVINLRTQVKADAKRAHAEGRLEEAEYLDGLQLALKLLANSTAYGVLVEVNPDDPLFDVVPIWVYGMTTHWMRTHVVERPGPYFAGALGALIPAGGRLLLAIAERLAADRGIIYAMCDTDSMAFARPEGMDREEFRRHIEEVCAWFTPLSPYHDQPPILEYEAVNDWQGRREPLYFLGISAKRYALYNRVPDGTVRIRKFSSHGVGTWQGRSGYVSPPHIPEPCETNKDGQPDSYKLGGERWHYDPWYDFIAAVEADAAPRDERGMPRYVPMADNPWLNGPAFHRVTLSTAELYRTYRHVRGMRPFGFLTALPPLSRSDVQRRERRLVMEAIGRGERPDPILDEPYQGLAGVAFYGPYARAASDLRDIRRSDTGELVTGIEHRTLAECLADYFQHPEWKSSDPRGVGVLPRRSLTILQHQHIGKESNRVKLATAEESDGVLLGDEAGIDGARRFHASGIAELLQGYAVADLLLATGIPRQTLYDLRNGATVTPTSQTVELLLAGLPLLDAGRTPTLVGWREIPCSWLMEQTGIPNERLRALHRGTSAASQTEREHIVVAAGQWQAERARVEVERERHHQERHEGLKLAESRYTLYRA